MLDIVLSFIGATLISAANVYEWSILLNKKINFKDYRLYISIIVAAVLLVLNYNSLIKYTTTIILYSLIINFIYRINFRKSIATTFFTQILAALSEIIFSIIVMYALGIDLEKKEITMYITLAADIFVMITCILAVKTTFIKKVYNNYIKLLAKIKIKYLLISLLPIIFLLNIYLETSYYKVDNIYAFLISNVSVYVVFIILLFISKRESEYTRMYQKYNTTLNSLKEYEKILDDYRVLNHENKNELLTIRNMLPKANKKAITYIDTIVENKLKDNDKIMVDASKIPEGGLRGLIYSKLLLMKDSKIDYNLSISKEVSIVDLINRIDDNTMLDVCKIVGVYLDNAIQAVTDLKTKYVSIDMYFENKLLVISISNNYEGKIDFDKLENAGYTSKGKGHGYGLTLTKKLINSNKKLLNEKSIAKNIFSQKLRIKI